MFFTFFGYPSKTGFFQKCTEFTFRLFRRWSKNVQKRGHFGKIPQVGGHENPPPFCQGGSKNGHFFGQKVSRYWNLFWSHYVQKWKKVVSKGGSKNGPKNDPFFGTPFWIEGVPRTPNSTFWAHTVTFWTFLTKKFIFFQKWISEKHFLWEKWTKNEKIQKTLKIVKKLPSFRYRFGRVSRKHENIRIHKNFKKWRNFTKFDKIWQNLTKFDKFFFATEKNQFFSTKSEKN